MTTHAHASFDARTLAERLGFEVVFVESCPSTQAIASELALAGHPDPIVVVADQQTSGRGRRERTWWSPPGEGLWFSIVLRPPVEVRRVPPGVLVWGAAIAEVLDVWLKWPNDLVDGGDRKLGGLLASLETAGPFVRHVVLGVGINVHQERFPGLPQATSLRLLRGEAPGRADLLARIVPALLSADIAAPGALDRWRSRARTLGRRVRVAGREGIATAVREDGALIVDGEPILAGDVTLLS